MALIGDQARLARLSGSSPLTTLAHQINSIRIVEAISQPFEIILEISSDQPASNVKGIIGSETVVEIGEHRWTGFVRSFAFLSNSLVAATNEYHYRAVLVPKLWYLAQSSHYRVYQGLSGNEIVNQVLGGYGINAVRQDTSADKDLREYCVQYGESDLALVERLIAEEGACYYFHHGTSGSELKIAQMPYGKPVSIDRNSLTNLSLEISTQVAQVTVVDYDDQQAMPVTVDKASRGEFRQPGSRVTTYAEGQLRKATGKGTLDTVGIKNRAEFLVQAKESYDGNACCQFELADYEYWFGRIYPGCELEGIEDVESLTSQKLVVVGTEFTFSEGYDSPQSSVIRVYCTLVEERLRLPLPEPRRSGGPVVARVVELKASASDTSSDPLRQVRVQFPWQDSKNTCWLRVAQAYAGQGWGASFVPRVDQDVLVDFINGNLERPVIVGALYNGKNSGPAYTATQSGYRSERNELRLDDKRDEEEFYVEAGHDLNCMVGNDRSTKVKNNDLLNVSKNLEIKVIGQRTDKVEKEYLIESSKSVLLKVGGCSIAIDQNGIVLEAMGNTISLKAGGISVKGTSVKINSESTAEFKANATMSVEGSAMAELKSGGMTTVKGSMTMIN